MAEYTRKHVRGRWAGKTDTVVEALTAARKTLSDWTDQEPSVRIHASVGGQDINTHDGDELEAILTKELGTVTSLNVKVSGGAAEVQLSFSSVFNGAEFQVSGEDSDAVRGLWAHLKDILDAGQHLPRWYARSHSALFAGVAWGLALSALLIALDARHHPDVRPPLDIALGGGLILIALFAWLTPNLELLEPGERSRIQRFRVGFVALAVSFIVGLAGSLAATAID